MIKGKILRDGADGLASANGQQHAFTLEQHWRSDTPPRVGMAVALELDTQGSLLTLRAIDTQQQVQDTLKALGADWQQHGMPAAQQLVQGVLQRVGWPTLVGMAAVFVGWVVLNTLSVRIAGNLTQSFSLRELLKLAQMAGGLESLGTLEYASTGALGWLMWLAWLAPLLPQVWRHRWAHGGALAPLAFMAVVGCTVYAKLQSSLHTAGDMARQFGGNQAAKMAQEMAAEMASQMWQAMSLGLGLYVASAAALFLAVRGVTALRR